MKTWNVVITIQEHFFKQAWQCLEPFGVLAKTDFYNVLIMQAGDPLLVLEQLQEKLNADNDLQSAISRVLPVTHNFTFQTPEEFETRARGIVEILLPELLNKMFYVRMHRRGFKDRLYSNQEEKFLDTFILQQCEQKAAPCKISFDDADVVIAVETVGQQAGLSLWHREQIERYPLLKLN